VLLLELVSLSDTGQPTSLRIAQFGLYAIWLQYLNAYSRIYQQNLLSGLVLSIQALQVMAGKFGFLVKTF
jgi:hypothetical protein